MSSTPKSVNLEGIFKSALARDTNQTGHDLAHHLLASKIDGFDPAESIVAISKNKQKHFTNSDTAISN